MWAVKYLNLHFLTEIIIVFNCISLYFCLIHCYSNLYSVYFFRVYHCITSYSIHRHSSLYYVYFLTVSLYFLYIHNYYMYFQCVI